MTALADELYARMHVINVHDLLKLYAEATGEKMPPAVYYMQAQTGRGSMPAKWQVVRPGFRTDPNAAWYDNGHKTFAIFHRDEREAKREAAKAWASERYGVTEWAPSRIHPGTLVPAVVMAWLKAELKKDAPVRVDRNTGRMAVD